MSWDNLMHSKGVNPENISLLQYLLFILIGMIVGAARWIVEGGAFSWRMLFAQAVLSGALAATAPLVLLIMPDLHPSLLIGVAAGLSVLGVGTLLRAVSMKLGTYKPLEEHKDLNNGNQENRK